MNDTHRVNLAETHLWNAPTVLYLEGKTDTQAFFSLLGQTPPRSGILGDVFVVGLSGGGSSEVRAMVRAAHEARKAGVRIGGRVFGIVDGDGRLQSELASEFDAPFVGPLFSWKGYCIENLLARSCWPSTWGTAPEWNVTLAHYAPYTALNRLHVELRDALETLNLHKYINPEFGKNLIKDSEIISALSKDKGRLHNIDIESKYREHLSQVLEAVAGPLEEAHCVVNGKWLMRHFARLVTGQSEEKCRDEWCEAVQHAGGLQEVKDWWQRITGYAP